MISIKKLMLGPVLASGLLFSGSNLRADAFSTVASTAIMCGLPLMLSYTQVGHAIDAMTLAATDLSLSRSELLLPMHHKRMRAMSAIFVGGLVGNAVVYAEMAATNWDYISVLNNIRFLSFT